MGQLDEVPTRRARAKLVGKLLGERAVRGGHQGRWSFDRGGYVYARAAWRSWPPAPAKPDLNSK